MLELTDAVGKRVLVAIETGFRSRYVEAEVLEISESGGYVKIKWASASTWERVDSFAGLKQQYIVPKYSVLEVLPKAS